MHHCTKDHIILSKWLVENEKSRLPCYSTHNLGAAGVVFSQDKQKILMIKENHTLFKNMWKFPGGLVDQGETIEEASVREVFEETGIKSEFQGILGIREQLNFRFGQGDLYFPCMMLAQNEKIQRQEIELLDAQWIEIVRIFVQQQQQGDLRDKQIYAMANEVTKHILKIYDQDRENVYERLLQFTLTSRDEILFSNLYFFIQNTLQIRLRDIILIDR
ncbi:nucleoside diphosphate-linked moiety x motif 6 [Stylonychia lemnae]|uniref:Nucleoside diphosphate-linked moiety x motif 6 n=1 Tax=Stylonychia lemnae TaxID=5949 RepID=A0A078B2T7_STYLE|nr:nucleoside diphosphate-linked moiety x motif 6 [Stylonychia lemnae]|eukprot:CDW88551.1 nucleoside diphosphate-linked moiety x motif 6 [Stylonychia lemnae]